MAPSALPNDLNSRTSVSELQKYGNPSLQVTADHRIKMVETPIPEPGPGEVLLHIKATGICGSDIHFWKRGAIGTLTVDGDCTLGHEAAGLVLRVHPTVTTLRPGDRVALEPGVPCISATATATAAATPCFLCRSGRYNLCPAVSFAGVYPHAGTLRRFATHPAQYCHPLPPHLPYPSAALLEPLSVVLHGLRTAYASSSSTDLAAALPLGRPVLVCGAGPIGLLALAAARASGAWPLVVTDVERARLDFAARFVPGVRTWLVEPWRGAKGNAEGVRALFLEGAGADRGLSEDEREYRAPDTVLECTGVESSVCTAAYAVRRGGTVCVIGVGKDVMNNLPFMHMSLAEINLKFINRYRDTWPAGIAALSAGIIDVKPLISHVFPLERANEALELCSDITKGSIKVQVLDDVDVPFETTKEEGEA